MSGDLPQDVQEPVAYACFTDKGKIRLWSTSHAEIDAWAKTVGRTVTPLYAAPQDSALAELEYWRKDSAAAWDKCEERRLENERLRAAPSDLEITQAEIMAIGDTVTTLRKIGHHSEAECWKVLEGHGFPPEACSDLPQAIDNAITCLINTREDLLAEAMKMRALHGSSEETAALIEKIIYENASISHFGDESEVDNAAHLAREIVAALRAAGAGARKP